MSPALFTIIKLHPEDKSPASRLKHEVQNIKKDLKLYENRIDYKLLKNVFERLNEKLYYKTRELYEKYEFYAQNRKSPYKEVMKDPDLAKYWTKFGRTLSKLKRVTAKCDYNRKEDISDILVSIRQVLLNIEDILQDMINDDHLT